MHSNLRHRHAARNHQKRDAMTLENSDSLANVVVERNAAGDDVATVYSVVFVTASATFSGPTAGYVTVGLPTTTRTRTKTSATESSTDATSAVIKGSAVSKTGTSLVLTTATVPPKSASAASVASSAQQSLSDPSTISSSVLLAWSLTSTTPTAVATVNTVASSSSLPVVAAAQATSSSSAKASPSAAAASSSPGLSSGAKGGIAFAVLLAIGSMLGIAFFCIRRKKEQRKNRAGAQRLDDEKREAVPVPVPTVNFPPAPPAPTERTISPDPIVPAPVSPPPVARTVSPAPRLSLRPTSGFSLGTDPEKAAASIGTIVATTDSTDRPNATRWPTTTAISSSPTTDPANPFGIHAETINNTEKDRVASPVPALGTSASTHSFELQGSPVPYNSLPSIILEEVESPIEPQSAAFQSTTSVSTIGTNSPGFPLNAELGLASAVPVIATAGKNAAQPLGQNVHRVQLEFLPTRDDELELRPGNLIRIMHEYDDGWALCMTMDRTKQGVAPRTCLSKLPLKPRPIGPPNSRPASPMGPPQAGMRKVSSPGAKPNPHSSMVPAPLMNGRMSPAGSPTPKQRQRTTSGPLSQPRPMSPGNSPSKPMANSRPRSASVGSTNNTAKSASPIGPSPLNPLTLSAIPSRKPVPGQAM